MVILNFHQVHFIHLLRLSACQSDWRWRRWPDWPASATGNLRQQGWRLERGQRCGETAWRSPVLQRVETSKPVRPLRKISQQTCQTPARKVFIGAVKMVKNLAYTINYNSFFNLTIISYLSDQSMHNQLASSIHNNWNWKPSLLLIIVVTESVQEKK